MSPTSVDRSALPHHPGLDGLRGVAVLMVIVFHSGLRWLPGGFLGVSLFFTLSGYLIVNLLVDESERVGRPRLGKFWSRRLRRLAPASLLVVGAVVGVATWISTRIEADRVRGDAVSAVAYVANWHSIMRGQSYEQLFAAPSPLQHLWSLSIEEQLYVAVPVIVFAVFVLGGGRRTLGTVFALGAVVSIVVTVFTTRHDVVYYGTHTRAAELLIGATLACAVGHRLAEPRWWWSAAGVVGLSGVVLAARLTGLETGWVYGGGLGLFALVSAMAIVGAIVPGIARTVLSWTPLTRVGRVSYGAYLVHWPVMVWMNEDRVDFGGVALFAVQVTVTLVVAAASFRFVEMPIRRRTLLSSPVRAGGAFAVTLALAVALPLVALPKVDARIDTTPDALSTLAPTTLAPVDEVPASDPTSTTVAFDGSGPLNILVIGDSTAENLARALADVDDPELGVIAAGVLGCPIQPAVEVRDRPDGTQDVTYCPDVLATIERYRASVDLVVLIEGLAEQWDFRTSASDPWVIVGSAQYEAALDATTSGIVAQLADVQVPLLLFEAPAVRDNPALLGDDPDAIARWSAMIESWDSRWPAVRTVPYADVLSDPNSEAGRRERPDGVHLDREFAASLARNVLIPRIRREWANVVADMGVS
ncbi:MAG: acyltransferase family protein [Acidimicrobiia bacterium]